MYLLFTWESVGLLVVLEKRSGSHQRYWYIEYTVFSKFKGSLAWNHCWTFTSHLCRLPQVARQSQLLRGVFPVLFHPLPAPVWADDVDNRVNFGMDIGQSVCLYASSRLLICMIRSYSHNTFVSLHPPHQGKQEDSTSRATWWLWWQAGFQGRVTLTLWGQSVSRNNQTLLDWLTCWSASVLTYKCDEHHTLQ